MDGLGKIKTNTILLTGSTGFVGSHILEDLLKNNFKVIIVKRTFSNTWRINKFLNDVKVYNLDKIKLETIFVENNIDIVIHCSTKYSKEDNNSEFNEVINANITFPTELLIIAKKYNVIGFINTGSFFQYELKNNKLIKEDINYVPFNFYSSTKIAFENICNYYSRFFPIINLILFSPYGPKDNQKLIPLIINSFIKNEKLELNDASNELDFIYIKDISNAYLKSIDYLLKTKSKKLINFNLGSGNSISVFEIIENLEKITGVNNKITFKKNNLIQKYKIISDITKIEKYLNWKPNYLFINGLRETFNWYKKNENNKN